MEYRSSCPQFTLASKPRKLNAASASCTRASRACSSRTFGERQLTVDAEESERLVLHIAIFERLMREAALGDWPGLGLAVQAYQPRFSGS